MSTKSDDTQKAPKTAEPAKSKKPAFCVAEGKAITSKRGILACGAEVTAADLAGGQEALDTLVEKKYIVKS